MFLLSENLEVLNPRISIKVHPEGPFLFQTHKYTKELKKMTKVTQNNKPYH